jgi:hypothetical protein
MKKRLHSTLLHIPDKRAARKIVYQSLLADFTLYFAAVSAIIFLVSKLSCGHDHATDE